MAGTISSASVTPNATAWPVRSGTTQRGGLSLTASGRLVRDRAESRDERLDDTVGELGPLDRDRRGQPCLDGGRASAPAWSPMRSRLRHERGELADGRPGPSSTSVWSPRCTRTRPSTRRRGAPPRRPPRSSRHRVMPAPRPCARPPPRARVPEYGRTARRCAARPLARRGRACRLWLTPLRSSHPSMAVLGLNPSVRRLDRPMLTCGPAARRTRIRRASATPAASRSRSSPQSAFGGSSRSCSRTSSTRRVSASGSTRRHSTTS